MPTVMEHHGEDPNQVVNPNVVPGAYPVQGYETDPSADMSQDVYAQQQAKMDNSGVNNVCKVKPQQQQQQQQAAAAAAMALAAQHGISSSPTFSSGAPTCNTPSVAAAAAAAVAAAAAAASAGGPAGLGSVGPLGYHQYGGMPAVPSPPAAMVYGSAPGQQLQGAPQAGIYGPFLDSNSQFSLLQVLNGPGNPGRSQFSHFMSPAAHGVGMGHAGLSNLGSLSNAGGGGPFAQQNILFQQPPPPSPAAPPNASSGGASGGHVPPSVAMNDLYQSSQYRLQGHGPFAPQSQHNNPGPMLISSNNSLGLKSSSYGSIGQSIHGSIGTKSAYQQQPTGHQHSQVFNNLHFLFLYIFFLAKLVFFPADVLSL
jgi:hypothetical protein